MTGRPRLFSAGDVSGFWALFADNLANMIIISGVLTGVFGMPAALVFGRVLPGLGVALLAGVCGYAWLALRLARREGRTDVTALPYGISTPVMFVFLFGVLGPAYQMTGDPLAAWRVGLAAAFVGGLLEVAGCLIGPLLKRLTPRAGMLGTLAGIALVWIAAVPLAELYQAPYIGLPALGVILVGLVARARLPWLPAGLAAIALGTGIALATGHASLTLDGVGFYPPVPVLADLLAGLQLLARHPELVAVIVPLEIYNFIETMNNVESAEAAGDRYDVRHAQLFDGLGTLLGAAFGSPFPTTVYIGHPGYKRLGARAGYALAVGLVFFVGSLFGLVAFLHHLIPVAAVAPMLVYIGLTMTGQAFTATPPAHAAAVVIAMLPHVSNLLHAKITSVLAAVGGLPGHAPLLADRPELLGALAAQGVHWLGHGALGQGAIISGMLWGALAANLIDGRWWRAVGFALAAALLTSLGVLHAPSLGLAWGPLAWGYLGLAGLLAAVALRGPDRRTDPG